MLGLCCCLGFSAAMVSGVYSLAVVHRFLIAVASLVAKVWALGHRGFSSWGWLVSIEGRHE